ncbi:hypothetical protein N665_0077s0022 [Sinapis alba]|nr:hypothetical protein N665_0077s0022 [Sinapis alba]
MGGVKRDHVFSHVIALNENELGFSGTLIHSFLSRQLVTSKLHELWFLRGYHCVLRTRVPCYYWIKIQRGRVLDFDNWKDDMGFWSKLLKRSVNISLKMIKKKHLKHIHKWTYVDRVRLIYVCLIARVLIAKNEKVNIPHAYIKMVMNIDKLQRYPWGREAFDELKSSYVLDGFSYVLQIWIMEAIPLFGEMLGKKCNPEFIGPCCGNWLGATKLSYSEINTLKASFVSDCKLFSYISSAGNCDILESVGFLRMDEKKDERWSTINWDFQEEAAEPIGEVTADIASGDDDDDAEEFMTPNARVITSSGYVKKKKKFSDVGAETREKKVLCQRFATTSGFLDEDMKSFF